MALQEYKCSTRSTFAVWDKPNNNWAQFNGDSSGNQEESARTQHQAHGQIELGTKPKLTSVHRLIAVSRRSAGSTGSQCCLAINMTKSQNHSCLPVHISSSHCHTHCVPRPSQSFLLIDGVAIDGIAIDAVAVAIDCVAVTTQCKSRPHLNESTSTQGEMESPPPKQKYDERIGEALNALWDERVKGSGACDERVKGSGAFAARILGKTVPTCQILRAMPKFVSFKETGAHPAPGITFCH